MKLTFAYLGRSRMIEAPSGGERILSLAPNLTREKVSFNAPLLEPLRFREAISALHDVVINDLRYQPRDKSAYEEWKKQQAEARREIYKREFDLAKKDASGTSSAGNTSRFRPTFPAHSQTLLGCSLQTCQIVAARRSGIVPLAPPV